MAKLQNRKVLVLNKGWNAVGVVTLERAIVMLFSNYSDGQPKAKIVDPTKDFQTFTWSDWSRLRPKHGEDTINGCNMVFRIPEVILLSRYDKSPRHKIHFSRRTIYKRDENQCQYCGKSPGTEELTIDHIIPRSSGGLTTWDNCILACVDCNSSKADIVPDRTTIIETRKDKDGNDKEVHLPAFIVYFKNKTKKTIKKPKKPTVPLFRGDVRIKSWESFLGEAYWNTTLDNDEKED